ncbi:MAG: aldehyde dehydrogenase family protein [Bacteroidales bacterium]|nr:aldehyde dehydrogenase family protein [Bacteroidales bacterium]
MQNRPTDRIIEISNIQKEFFKSGKSLNIHFRKSALKRLLAAIESNEELLYKALWIDLHKSYEEAYLTEISIIKAEIKTHLKNLSKWAAKKRVSTPLHLFPSKSYIVKEPLGSALIISPWNYPVQLLINPLIGAISAGCTALLKPSPYVPTVSSVIEKIIKESFNEEYIAVVQGHRDVNETLLQIRWDIIFFTGSPSLGRTVMAAAAKNLTPVILELGGKSPCIVDKTADLKIAAKRIAWGKTLNSGQTCIAPDYILIHKDVKEKFVEVFSDAVKEFPDSYYVHMVNEKAFQRVLSYMEEGNIIYGGKSDKGSLLIEPTLLDNVSADSRVMTEEIFGPVFPIITLDDTGNPFKEKVIEFVNSREKPLAFYYFGKESDGWDIIGRTSSGGGCINDVIMHIANDNLPFGGVGNSGMGNYHNKKSFEAFSHTRSIISTTTKIDLPFRYMPYRLFKFVKKFI